MTGIFIDLDGTLLNDNDQISKDDLAYLLSIKDKYNIYITTGKAYDLAINYYNELKLDTWLITSQGQVITKGDLKHNMFIDKKYISKLINMNYLGLVIETNNCYFEQGDIGIDLKSNKLRTNDVNDIDETILGIYVRHNDELNIDLDKYSWDIGNNNSLTILRPKGINKETAFDFVKESDRLDNTIFIGNGRSDINSMLKSDVSIAMINSFESVKENAMHISVDDNNNSGVSKTLRKILD